MTGIIIVFVKQGTVFWVSYGDLTSAIYGLVTCFSIFCIITATRSMEYTQVEWKINTTVSGNAL
jgi:hypothetical protein